MPSPYQKVIETLNQDGHADLAVEFAEHLAAHSVEPNPLDEVRAMSEEQINQNWDRVQQIMKAAA